MDKAIPTTVIAEDLLPGDLLFQLRAGGEEEWAISRLFPGRDGVAVNHVAIYDGDEMVIEAVTPGVKKTLIDDFINSSVLDNHGRPCVLVCRLKPNYSSLIPAALEFCEQQLQTPYNSHFASSSPGDSLKSWYCSELIVHAFRHANEGYFLFEQTPMSFRDMETGELLPFWVSHYKKSGETMPQGLPGSHPALLSSSEWLLCVNVMGALPARVGRQVYGLEEAVV